MMTHAPDAAAVRGMGDLAGLREGDRYLIVNPFFHTFGYKAGMRRVASCAARRSCRAGVRRRPRACELIGGERITMLPGPPTLYQSLLAVADRELDLSSLRAGVTGAADVPVELVRRMRDELAFETIVTGYGLTEAGIVTLCRPATPPRTSPRPSGRAVPDVEVRVGRRRRGAGPRLQRDAGLPRRSRRHRRGDRRRRLAAHRRRRRAGRRRATCASPTARRTCSSSAASTPTRPRSRDPARASGGRAGRRRRRPRRADGRGRHGVRGAAG